MPGRGALPGGCVAEDLRQSLDHGGVRAGGLRSGVRRGPGGAAVQFRAEDVNPPLQQPAHIAEVGLVALGPAAQGAQLRQAQQGEIGLLLLLLCGLRRFTVGGRSGGGRAPAGRGQRPGHRRAVGALHGRSTALRAAEHPGQSGHIGPGGDSRITGCSRD